MKKLVTINTFDIAFWIGLILWLAETAYFGWNASSENMTERVLDIICGGLIFYGVTGMVIVQAVKCALHELAIEKYRRENNPDA